jgi:putative ABC transport system permease protein
MALLRTLLDGVFRRSRAEAEMAQELRFHLESRAADLQRRGYSRQKAERQARMEFGSQENYKEECRSASGFHFFDDLRGDLRYAFRTLRRSPGFAAVTVLSLALGIGVNLVIFASLYYVVLHPFPYPDLDRIAVAFETRTKAPAERHMVAAADYLDWKQANHSFAKLAAYQDWDVNLTGTDHPDHIQAALASAEFFDVLGIHPRQGRTFTAVECEPGKEAVAVVSYGFWKTRLASRPDAIGQALSLGGRKYTVIGVMPDEFNLPLSAELWAPLSFAPEKQNQRKAQSLLVIGKLKDGVAPAQAGAELKAIAKSLEQRYPQTNDGRQALVAPLKEAMETESNRFILVLAGAAAFVLLLACANVGSLQVARMASRQREFGLRSALGANLFRMVRQIVTESLLLGLAGGVLGLLLAMWDLRFLRSTIPVMVYRFVPGLRDMQINGENIILGIALSLVAGLLCCAPAVLQVVQQVKAGDANGTLKESGRSTTASPTRNRLRALLVSGEVALAFVLLIGAVLMVGSFQRMLQMNLGYDPNGILAGEIALNGEEYQKPARTNYFYRTVLENMSRLPDVEGAAASGELPAPVSVAVEGQAQTQSGVPKFEVRSATPQYLTAMRIPLLQGRWIADRDRPESMAVVVLSESVARQYWPSADPIGQHIKFGNAEAPLLTVVGVVGDVNDWFLGNPLPAAYVSYQQFPQAAMQVVVRTRHDPHQVASFLRREVQSVDHEQPLYNVRTLQEQLYDETSGVRNAARMMTMYAAIALLLALAGIYSICSYFVAERTREIGVRMSLGATKQAILRMVMFQSCALTGSGLLVGLPLAVALTVATSHVLYHVVTLQPGIFILVLAVFGATAALAGYFPAYRATQVEPMIALRHE